MRDFEAVGYTKPNLCRQPDPVMAIDGGFFSPCRVDATNIKINPSLKAV